MGLGAKIDLFLSRSRLLLLVALVTGIVAARLLPVGPWIVAGIAMPLTAGLALLVLHSWQSGSGFKSDVLLIAAFSALGLWLYANQALTPYGLLQEWTFPSRCASALSHRIDLLFDGEAAALLKALLIGDKSGLSTDTVAAFRASGASHVLALSGLHLGIIYATVSYTLYFLKSPIGGALRCFSILAFCTFYAVMTGLSPSISRALIFIFIRELSLLRGGQSLGTGARLFETLTTAALVQLCFFGASSLFSIGFALSYLAILGIALLASPLQGLFPAPEKPQDALGRALFYPVRALKYVWDLSAMSIACQLTTAPLVWFYFHSLSWNFLITNIIVLPLATVTIVVGILGLVTGWMPLCDIAAWGLDAMIFSVRIIAS